MSVYLCLQCDKWYSTKHEWKNHDCDRGATGRPPVTFEKPKVQPEKVEGMLNTVGREVDSATLTALNMGRTDLIAELKEKEIIKDARSVKGKSEEELADMLKENEG